MTSATKRRWYQFSLRMMIALAAVAAVLCGFVSGRVRYLKTRADHHRREFVRFAACQPIYPNGSHGWFDDAFYHENLQKAYERAMYRPWNIIDETPPPVTP